MVFKLILMLKLGQHSGQYLTIFIFNLKYNYATIIKTWWHFPLVYTEPATPLHQTPALSTIYTEPTPTVTPHGRHPTSSSTRGPPTARDIRTSRTEQTRDKTEEHSLNSMVISDVCWDFPYKALCDGYKSLQSCFDIHMKKGKLSVLENLFYKLKNIMKCEHWCNYKCTQSR